MEPSDNYMNLKVALSSLANFATNFDCSKIQMLSVAGISRSHGQKLDVAGNY